MLLECAIVYFFITRRTATEHLPLLQRLNAWIASQNLQPWQVVLASWLSVHVYSNFSLLMGLNAPHSSLYMEPDVHYTNSFSRIRWLLTALDAGFLSTMKVRIPVLREVLAILLSIYYLIFTRKGEVKVDSFRRAQTIQAIRRTWQKGQHPLFRFISWCTTPRIAVPGNIIGIPRADGTSSISCHFFFNGTPEELKRSRKLIIHFPGGGFVAMNPFHHKDYLTQYALRLKVPVVSVDYRKAPEYPYPSGFDDAFTIYQTLVQSNGRIIGIESAEPLRIAVTGDSAGGNLSATVTMRAINEGIQVPHGVHMIYPSLDFAGGMWRDQSGPKELVAKTPAQVNSRAQYAFDGVLPIKYMLTLGEAYLRSGGDPVNDYYISPARAPAELLAKFPPVRLLSCTRMSPSLGVL